MCKGESRPSCISKHQRETQYTTMQLVQGVRTLYKRVIITVCAQVSLDRPVYRNTREKHNTLRCNWYKVYVHYIRGL